MLTCSIRVLDGIENEAFDLVFQFEAVDDLVAINLEWIEELRIVLS